LIGVYNHEPWRDEFQAYLIARSSHSLGELFQNIKYEGHPKKGLYFILPDERYPRQPQEIWTQGYSEPQAGSDLASLTTSAELAGDHFVLNGRKLWASYAHVADRMFALVRTDQHLPRHQGISYLLIDMRAAGVTARPLVQIDGKRDFSEVTFRDVRVEQEDVVGGLHNGWKVANSTLANERGNMGLNSGPLMAFP